MSDDRFEQVEIHVDEVMKSTDKAALCRINDEQVWLPWSQIDEGSDIQSAGDCGRAYIPRWLANEHGLEAD